MWAKLISGFNWPLQQGRLTTEGDSSAHLESFFDAMWMFGQSWWCDRTPLIRSIRATATLE